MLDFKRDQEQSAIMEINPDIARHLLSTSIGNRKIRYWHVDVLAGAMARGEWRVTSQGIGIDKNGNLRDAHHRLMAVVKSGVTIKSVVVMGLPLNAYEVTDTGINRNMADLLNENKRLTDVLNIAARLYYDTSRPVTIDLIRPIMKSGLFDTAKTLISHCGTARVFYSSAPVKLAACITIMNGGDADYVMQQYRALCILDFKSMSAASMSLVKQVNDGKANTRSSAKEETICRALRTFDINQKDSSESTIKPEAIVAGKKLVIDVLKNKIASIQNSHATEEIETFSNETHSTINRKKITVEEELKQLMDESPAVGNSYIHKHGDRKKYAATR